MSHFNNQLHQSLSVIRGTFDQKVSLGLVFGSGLGDSFLQSSEIIGELSYSQIPFWHEAGVDGHDGKLYQVLVNGICLWVLKGRMHLYEGLNPWQVTLPIRTISELGLSHLILTNASGSLNPIFKMGDCCIIKDQINLTHGSSVFHPEDQKIKDPFLDPRQLYNPELRKRVLEKAKEMREGVYLGVTGPCYETNAEIEMYRKWGADFVGMSTVLEALMAGYMGLNVLGLTCVANSPLESDDRLTHDGVLQKMKEMGGELSCVLQEIIIPTINE